MNISQRINDIEEKYKLNAIEFDGFHPWTYTRFYVYRDLMFGYKVKKQPLWWRVKSYISIFKKCVLLLFKRCFPPQRDVDVLFLCSGRRSFDNGVYENIYTDSIAELYPNSITLEQEFNLTHFSPPKTKNLFYTDRISVIAYLKCIITKYILNRNYTNKKVQIHELFKIPLGELAGSDDVYVAKWLSKMTDSFFLFKYVYKKYAKLLRYISPKIIIEEDYYTFRHMVINEIAKNFGIPTIELQHGATGIKNIICNFPIGESIDQFPDIIFLFSEYYKKNATYPISQDKLIPTGFPYFERQIKQYIRSTKISDKKSIVFIGCLLGGLDSLAFDVHNRVKYNGWKVIVKLHPLEYKDWNKNYPVLVGSGVEIVDTQEKNIYEIFASCTALVGVMSTAIYEGIGFGLHAYIYDCPESELYNDLCEIGLVKKVKDCESLCNELENLSDEKSMSEKGAFLWKPNALENMKKEIDRILLEV